MRNTVYVSYDEGKEDEILASVEKTMAEVQEYVPGYRLTGKPIFDVRDTPEGK